MCIWQGYVEPTISERQIIDFKKSINSDKYDTEVLKKIAYQLTHDGRMDLFRGYIESSEEAECILKALHIKESRPSKIRKNENGEISNDLITE